MISNHTRLICEGTRSLEPRRRRRKCTYIQKRTDKEVEHYVDTILHNSERSAPVNHSRLVCDGVNILHAVTVFQELAFWSFSGSRMDGKDF